MTIKARLVLHMGDKDKQVTEIFYTFGDSPEAKSVELVYTRKK